jgi:hypothetical protein
MASGTSGGAAVGAGVSVAGAAGVSLAAVVALGSAGALVGEAGGALVSVAPAGADVFVAGALTVAVGGPPAPNVQAARTATRLTRAGSRRARPAENARRGDIALSSEAADPIQIRRRPPNFGSPLGRRAGMAILS